MTQSFRSKVKQLRTKLTAQKPFLQIVNVCRVSLITRGLIAYSCVHIDVIHYQVSYDGQPAIGVLPILETRNCIDGTAAILEMRQRYEQLTVSVPVLVIEMLAGVSDSRGVYTDEAEISFWQGLSSYIKAVCVLPAAT